MNLIVLICSLSMTSVSGQVPQWVEIGGKNYDFNPVLLSQSEARTRCIREGGKLFEPRGLNGAKTNRDVFVQAGAALGNAGTVPRALWIGVSDVGSEGDFTYLSDGKPVNWVCESSHAGRVGCWMNGQPVGDTDENCVVGSAGTDGKWDDAACAGNAGSICERDGTTSTSPPSPTPTASGSTCLESGTALILGMFMLLM